MERSNLFDCQERTGPCPARTRASMPPRLYWVHGSGYTQDSFREQLAAFPDSVALSLPGHPIGEPLTTVGDMADWLERSIRSAGAGKAVVGGNSLGGAIAMEWALRHPESAAGLILIGTGARLRVSQAIFEMIDREWPSSIPKLVDFALSSGAPADLRERAQEWHRIVGREATHADYAACDAFDVMDRLPDLDLPVLIVVGGADRLTPPKFSHYLRDHIPRSDLLEVPDAGHVVMAERPDVVNAAIASFLQGLSDS
jgi:pimeloyl-ACP methyl ester carboxylesterase